MTATFRQPFDPPAEATAIAARQEAGNAANSAKREIWLGDVDSNHDTQNQNLQSYH
jgi:hypothetical protein